MNHFLIYRKLIAEFSFLGLSFLISWPINHDYAHNLFTEKVEVLGAVTEDWAYQYDRHNRLLEKRSNITNAAEINQYDANGNRIRVTRPGVTQEFLFDSRDVMSLSKEGTTLLGMYDYNFAGMRVRHEGSDRGDVSSFYDGINVLEESIGSYALRYAYGLDTSPISLKSAGGFEYYHQATLGTTTALTDAAGNIKVNYRTGPWGDIGEQSGNSQNRMIFTSQEHDPNTGLVYFGARYYEPGLGRFVSNDPWFVEQPERCLDRPMECNLWGYAAQRVSKMKDLNGLFVWPIDRDIFGVNSVPIGLPNSPTLASAFFEPLKDCKLVFGIENLRLGLSSTCVRFMPSGMDSEFPILSSFFNFNESDI